MNEPSNGFGAVSGIVAEKLSYYFSIKWLIPFYPALIAQAAGGGEKCMDYVF